MIKLIRDTNVDFMNGVLELVKKSGNYDKAEPIMDSFITGDGEVRDLTNYTFNFFATINYCVSGIYLNCRLAGCFDENHRYAYKTISCGTFKTLRNDLEAIKIMGELAGSLTYYARQYVDSELSRYTPLKERLFKEYDKETIKDKKEGGTYKVKNYLTNVRCPRCGKPLFTSSVYPYSFMCLNCNENFYSSEIKIPQSKSVIMTVPFKWALRVEDMIEAYQAVSKKNHCAFMLSGSSFIACWDNLPEAEDIRNTAIGLDIYMENYRTV